MCAAFPPSCARAFSTIWASAQPSNGWRTISKRARISLCTIDVPEDLSLPFDLATPLFRVCQEALTNVTRHASATSVAIELACSPSHISLSIKDNGRGITEEEIKRYGSLGLLGMKERISILGGTLDVEGKPGVGTALAIEIPLSPNPNPRD